ALGGAWGALASGLFAVTLGSGIETNLQQVMVQLRGIAFVIGFAPVATAGILMGLRFVFGPLRVAEEAEHEGLDLSEHSEGGCGDRGRVRRPLTVEGECSGERAPWAAAKSAPAGRGAPVGAALAAALRAALRRDELGGLVPAFGAEVAQ